MILVILFFATLFLSYVNGANDNFKGVATLYGSKTLNYKQSLTWATITTFTGSIVSIFFAEALLINFSGKGLVPDIIIDSPIFLTAVGLGAGITVLLATLKGFPISTTHSLVGGLLGAGFMAIGNSVNFSSLGKAFFLPLLLSPLIALVLAGLFYLISRYFRLKLNIEKEMCICKNEIINIAPIPNPNSALSAELSFTIKIGKEAECYQQYKGKMLGINIQKILDFFHFLSAGIVSFARGLNDTPKIAALLLILNTFDIRLRMLPVAIAMAVGGILNASKVANTMSKKITEINRGQGFVSNFISGILIIFASKIGVPVSTTHVTIGSLFGIGLVSRKAKFNTIKQIILSWLITLPMGALLSAGAYFLLKNLNLF